MGLEAKQLDTVQYLKWSLLYRLGDKSSLSETEYRVYNALEEELNSDEFYQHILWLIKETNGDMFLVKAAIISLAGEDVGGWLDEVIGSAIKRGNAPSSKQPSDTNSQKSMVWD